MNTQISMNNAFKHYTNTDGDIIVFTCINERQVFISWSGSAHITGTESKTISVHPTGGPILGLGYNLLDYTGEDRTIYTIELSKYGALLNTSEAK